MENKLLSSKDMAKKIKIHWIQIGFNKTINNTVAIAKESFAGQKFVPETKRYDVDIDNNKKREFKGL